jgi:hypothetical protein
VRRKGFVLAASLALGALLWVERARACLYARTCEPLSVAPIASALIPANAPAFVIERARGLTSTSMAAKLERVGGGEVPTQLDALSDRWLLRLLAPLAPTAEYRFTIFNDCSGEIGVDKTSSSTEFALTAGPASALPTTVGAVTLRYGDHVVASDWHYRLAELELTPSTRLQAYLPLVQLRTYVDGEPWASAPLGTTRTSAVPFTDASYSHDFLRVVGSCEGYSIVSCDEPVTVSAAPHAVEVRAEIVGVDAPIVAASVQIDLTCATPGAIAASAPNGEPAPAHPTTPAPGGAAPASLPMGGGGCAIGSRRARSEYEFALALLSALLAARIRRQVRVSSDDS